MSTITSDLSATFKKIFDQAAEQQFFSPGRINLIGEHTDYNGGYVFPCAITLGTYGAVAKRTDRQIRLYSQNFPEDGVYQLSLDHLEYDEADGWTNYVKGMLFYIQKLGFTLPFGLDIAIVGNIPNGAGLSSSASLEMLIGTIANQLYDLKIDPIELVKLGKKVENEFIGVQSGIMDQFAVGMGRKNQAILLDCNTLAYQLVPLDLKECVIVIMNTNKRRELADSKYNERFNETRQALHEIQKIRPINALCELTIEEFERLKDHLSSDTLVMRARHAISENQRTKIAAEALKRGDLKTFGTLLKESHLSTELDYEITGKELDTLVHTAWELPGVIGARMTGAGFGGCAIAIVQKTEVDHFISEVEKQYLEKIGYAPSFYIANSSDGATL